MIKGCLLHKDKNENGKQSHIQAHLAAQNTSDRFVSKRTFILPANSTVNNFLKTK